MRLVIVKQYIIDNYSVSKLDKISMYDKRKLK